MKVVTAEVMRALDRRAIEGAGIPGAVLMEHAGRAVVEFLVERFGPLRDRAFGIHCGTGNNGGDGFVVGRYLHLAGARVAVLICGDAARIQGDARVHLEILEQAGVQPSTDAVPGAIQIDALLGTGAHGAPRGPIADAIRCMNSSGQPIISVDIPSGLDSDSGETPGEAVRATATITFGYPKLGLFLNHGPECRGELVVKDIGFPWDTLDVDSPYRCLALADVRPLLPARPRDAHKGMFGHVLIVGGSRGMSGAPAMAAHAALRAGAGLVTVAAPESAQPLVASHRPEVMTCAVPEASGALCEASFDAIFEGAKTADVLCIGPGASRNLETQSLIARLLREIDKPAVVDADGLNALAEHPDSLNSHRPPIVLTPHPGECARLLGQATSGVQADRLLAVKETARRFRAIVVLKGAQTLIADGRNDSGELPVTINATGNPGMATAGSGDSLTGIIGSLIGQGLDAYDAAALGAYIHGRAGDIAASRFGLAPLIAGDIIDCLPDAIRELEDSV